MQTRLPTAAAKVLATQAASRAESQAAYVRRVLLLHLGIIPASTEGA